MRLSHGLRTELGKSMRHLDLALLRTFLAVAETGGATRAALRVHLTQAAVSQQVRRLEETIGRPLFERDRKGFVATAAGERLTAQARRLLALNDELLDSMGASERPGEIHLGVPHDIAFALMPPVLKAFRREWPRVELTLTCATSHSLLGRYGRGEIDLCLTTELGCPAGAERLYPDPLVWVGAPGGDAWLREPLPVAIGDRTCAFRRPALTALGQVGREWRMVAESGEMDALQVCLQADLAIGVLMLSTLPANVAVLPAEAGMPPLPPFDINLYPPRAEAGRPALEMARLIRCMLGAGAPRRQPVLLQSAA